jgi:hypothetical protein
MLPWSGLEEPDSDLCLNFKVGWWDIVHRYDGGWVVYGSVAHSTRDLQRVGQRFFYQVEGSREEALTFAENWIRGVGLSSTDIVTRSQ